MKHLYMIIAQIDETVGYEVIQHAKGEVLVAYSQDEAIALFKILKLGLGRNLRGIECTQVSDEKLIEVMEDLKIRKIL